MLCSKAPIGIFSFPQEGVRGFPDLRCSLVPAWTTQYPALLAYGVPKESPYTQFLYFGFLQLKENGALRVAEMRWKAGEPSCTPARVTRWDFCVRQL